MLVLMGKRVSMYQGLNHFSGCLHHFVLAKLATSSIRDGLSMVQHISRTASLGTVECMTKIMPLFTENAPVYCLLYNCISHIYINLKREIGLFGDQTNLPGQLHRIYLRYNFLNNWSSSEALLLSCWQLNVQWNMPRMALLYIFNVLTHSSLRELGLSADWAHIQY